MFFYFSLSLSSVDLDKWFSMLILKTGTIWEVIDLTCYIVKARYFSNKIKTYSRWNETAISIISTVSSS